MADWFDSIPSVDFSQLGYDVDLTPIAASLGLTRDQLAAMRDDWNIQQRARVIASGGKAAEDDRTLFSQVTGAAPIEGGQSSGQPSSFSPAQYAPSQGVGLSSILGQQPQAPSVAPFAFDPSTINQQPGFKFQLDEGLKLLDRSAAAKGKSFTPDARQAAQQWGQGLASTALNDEYGRQMGTWQANTGQANTGFDQQRANLSDARAYDSNLWTRGNTENQQQYQRGVDAWGMGRQNNLDQFDQGYRLSDLILSNRPRPA